MNEQFLAPPSRLALAVMAALLLGTQHTLATDLSLPAILSDGVVFQRGEPIRVWGNAKPGQKVSATLNGRSNTSVTTVSGTWDITLPAQESINGDLLIQTSGGESHSIRSPLIGQVWLCGGQSNMAMPVKRAMDANRVMQELKESSTIHLYRSSGGRFNMPESTWLSSNNKNSENFSAVCLMVGIELARYLKEPIGLIDTSVGGTRMLAWTPQPKEGKSSKREEFSFDQRNRLGRGFSTVIEPITPLRAKGIVWYQGEADSNRHTKDYAESAKTTFTKWRDAFQQPRLAIVIVGLPSFSKAKNQSSWEEIQKQQRQIPSILNDSLYVDSSDLSFDRVHPKEKTEVSMRIAKEILKKIYAVR